MHIKIDLADFYLDSDDHLESALREHVKSEVVREIWKRISDAVQTQITQQVSKVIEEQVNARVAATVDMLIEKGEIVRNRETIKITDHITKLFAENNAWNNVGDPIKRLAESYAKQLKDRYDIAFANRLVVKINEQGLLKEDVARLLLEGS